MNLGPLAAEKWMPSSPPRFLRVEDGFAQYCGRVGGEGSQKARRGTLGHRLRGCAPSLTGVASGRKPSEMSSPSSFLTAG